MKLKLLTPFLILTCLAVNAQNVGIGTTTPSAKLDVNSSDNFVARFNGSNQMYIGLFESANLRGYLGSFSGNAEDVDIGTSTSNTTGKLHLTINAAPKMTINTAGNVGIGTTAPAEKMDVTGNIKMTGELKPNGVSGTNGQVLTSNGNGTMQWSSMTTQNSTNGNGGWGDCSIYNIDSYQPVGNTGTSLGNFGGAVAISGNYAIVGAANETVNPDLISSGTATIYKLNSTTGQWESQIKFNNQNPFDYHFFGSSVSISGDFAIVGCPGQENGGSVSIYKRNTGTDNWEFQGKIFNPNTANDDRFGTSVSISGDYLIVGAEMDDESGFNNTGSATIFKRNTTTGIWESQGKLINPAAQANDLFGCAVSISGDYAIVGAKFDDEWATDNGTATIFKRNTTTGLWESQGKFLGPFSNYAECGASVSINGGSAIIGAPKDDQLSKVDNGSAIIYALNAVTNTWDFQGNLFNLSTADDDYFGTSVYITPDYAMVGAFGDDENGETSNGTVNIYKRINNNWMPFQKFTYPSSITGSNFGYSVGLDNTSKCFISGAPYFQNGKGLAFFGKIK